MRRLLWIPAVTLLVGLFHLGGASAQVISGSSHYVPDDIPLPMALQWKYSSVKLGAPLPARSNPSAPVLVDGVVYACARGVTPDNVASTALYALSLDTGEKLWERILEGTVFGNPAVTEEMIFVADTKGYLYSLDRKNKGEEILSYDLKSGTRCTPVVHNGLVYVGTEAGEVIALDVKTLQPKWRIRVGWPVVAPVAISPEYNMIFVASSEPNLLALRLTDGALLWQHKMPRTTMEAAPLIWNNNLYVASGEVLMCLTIRKGETKWQFAIRQHESIIGTPALAPDEKGGARIYVTCQDGTVMAVNAANGAGLWRAPVLLDPAAKSAPVLTKNAVLVGADGGMLWALSPATGQVIWKYRALPPRDIALQTTLVSVSASPAISQGRLVALMDEGTILCFAPDAVDVTPPDITSTQPDDQTPVYGRKDVVFSAKLEDEGSGVNDYRIEFRIDGAVVKHSYAPRSGQVWYIRRVTQPIKPMADGRHTATVSVIDWHGNATTREWSFHVDNSRIPVPQPPPGMVPGGGGETSGSY